MSVIPRFDGLYGRGYDAVVSRAPLLRAAQVLLGSGALGAVPDLIREAYAAAPDAPLLDVPCGALASLAHASGVRRTAEVVGVDLSEPMLERARRRVRRLRPAFDVELVHGDALALPVEDDAFATVLSVNGVHCMADPAGFVSEVARVLQPGGWFLLTTLVDAGTTTSRAVNDAFRRGGVIPEAPPTLDQLRRLLDRSGFDVVELAAGRGMVALRCRRAG